MVKRIGNAAMPRAFLSYSTSDGAIIACEFKRFLEYLGVDAFLAHEDIKPGEIWPKEILRELKSCDVFIPILTKGAKTSPYVNQEIGYAIAREADIIPFKVDIDPFGFISEKQGLKALKNSRGELRYDACAMLVIERMMNDHGLNSRLRDSVIAG